ncbi:asparagine synthase-related protein [Plantactinospora sonchi]|uniref:asparagine synthase (glutamine-hydrolyzing) n=1 Tax=Plantactinospora sonchi TaxID=1544735 RepID=A0ABU7S410_9ACTN
MEFVVLPDHPAAAGIARRVRAAIDDGAVRILNHHSGRPWLVGRWSDEDITWAGLGENRLALLGSAGVTATRLAELLRGVRTGGDLTALAGGLAGAFHLVASLGGRVHGQGTLSSACQLFYGPVAGVTVAADRPQTLARLTGAGIVEELLPLQILAPFGPPWPLNDRCLWRGVRTLTPGHRLGIEADGTARTVSWWTPPEPEVPLAEGAGVLRDALVAAVEARTARGVPVSADLSGGMDSTSLCYLIAGQGVPLVTFHYDSVDPSSEDRLWAARCLPDLPVTRHLVVPPGTGPGMYAELATPDPCPDLEAPLSMIRRATVEHSARQVAEAGSRRHVMGLGSDELFRPSLMTLHALARRHPLRSVRQIRAFRSMRRWSWATTVRSLSPIEPYPRWLASRADQLTTERRWDAEVDWEVAAKMPPWATREAVDAARRLLLDAAAERPEPLAGLPVQHEMIRLSQVNGTMIRRSSRVGEQFGVSFQAPFVDDRVLEAALSIRLADRMAVGWAKPVLSAALRGVAPDDLLARKNKGDHSPELYTALRRYRRELRDLCDDSHLVRLGLADRDALASVLFGLHPDARPLMPFDVTLNYELWLRSLSGHTRGDTPDSTPAPVRATELVLAEGAER